MILQIPKRNLTLEVNLAESELPGHNFSPSQFILDWLQWSMDRIFQTLLFPLALPVHCFVWLPWACCCTLADKIAVMLQCSRYWPWYVWMAGHKCAQQQKNVVNTWLGPPLGLKYHYYQLELSWTGKIHPVWDETHFNMINLLYDLQVTQTSAAGVWELEGGLRHIDLLSLTASICTHPELQRPGFN
jgi:hypothetical protein